MKTAIRDCSDSFRDLLSRELMDDIDLSPFFDPLDPSPTAIGTFVVNLNNPEEFVAREFEGVSLWLYLVERDAETLNLPPRRTAPNRLPSRPLPLRLHYLLTPRVDHRTRAQAGELEQLILGKVMQVLHDGPRLAGNQLSTAWRAARRSSSSAWSRCRWTTSRASGTRSRCPTSSRVL